jgi:tetratricopeptide (TPR) repeat protein
MGKLPRVTGGAEVRSTARTVYLEGHMTAQAQPKNKGSNRLGAYLHKLRSGYGYSLRRVEERAKAEGGEIDNSQLSRYEKGICYPSFDKLRILASVFNVSIQSFADIVDLEAYETLKPAGGDALGLIEDGNDAFRKGNNGQAFALFESALELLKQFPDDAIKHENIGRARINQAVALQRLGKLALAEQELRRAMRDANLLTPQLRIQALLALSVIHGCLGDHFLSEMEAERAYKTANEASLDRLAAMALHTLAQVNSDQGEFLKAIETWRKAAKLYDSCDERYESTRIRINIATCYVSLEKVREGIRMLKSALRDARTAGYRRLEAVAWSHLGLAYYRQDDAKRAQGCFRESDARAIYNKENHPDIQFFNAYYQWKMAQTEDNPTREKIAFGRLKALRSCIERRLPEVEAFDVYVEGGRSHA